MEFRKLLEDNELRSVPTCQVPSAVPSSLHQSATKPERSAALPMIDPALEAVLAAWPLLSTEVKAAIRTLAEAVAGKRP